MPFEHETNGQVAPPIHLVRAVVVGGRKQLVEQEVRAPGKRYRRLVIVLFADVLRQALRPPEGIVVEGKSGIDVEAPVQIVNVFVLQVPNAPRQPVCDIGEETRLVVLVCWVSLQVDAAVIRVVAEEQARIGVVAVPVGVHDDLEVRVVVVRHRPVAGVQQLMEAVSSFGQRAASDGQVFVCQVFGTDAHIDFRTSMGNGQHLRF